MVDLKLRSKIACSLDGKISSHKGVRSKITNVLSNKIVHLIRSQHDAILIGSNTLRVDNPKLNCRLSGLEKQSPLRVILASKLNFNDDLEILKNCTAQKTIFFTKETNQRKISFFTKKGVEVITFTKKDLTLKQSSKNLQV